MPQAEQCSAFGNTRPEERDPELVEMMALNYRVAKLDERQRAMLDFTWKLTLAPNDTVVANCEHSLEIIPNRCVYHTLNRPEPYLPPAADA